MGAGLLPGGWPSPFPCPLSLGVPGRAESRSGSGAGGRPGPWARGWCPALPGDSRWPRVGGAPAPGPRPGPAWRRGGIRYRGPSGPHATVSPGFPVSFRVGVPGGNGPAGESPLAPQGESLRASSGGCSTGSLSFPQSGPWWNGLGRARDRIPSRLADVDLSSVLRLVLGGGRREHPRPGRVYPRGTGTRARGKTRWTPTVASPASSSTR